MRRLLLSGALLLASPRAFGAVTLWNDVSAQKKSGVDRAIEHAQAELDTRAFGGTGPANGARAEALLKGVLKAEPKHFVAAFLLGQALALQGKPTAAAVAHACTLAQDAAVEGLCVLQLGVELSKAGAYDRALAAYDRHIRLGAPSAMAFANSAEVLMALGRVTEAVPRFQRAVALEERAPRGRERDERLALARFGLAVALDRAGRAGAAQDALAAVLDFDPRLDLIDAQAAGDRAVFFVPPADAHYYRGFALAQMAGRTKDAIEAFRAFIKDLSASPYVPRAAAHLAQLAGGPASASRARVVAAATVHAEGPLPSPLIDAVWKREAKTLADCFASVTVSDPATARVTVDVVISAAGAVESVSPTLPDTLRGAEVCLQDRVRAFRLPKAGGKGGRTTARLVLVLAIKP